MAVRASRRPKPARCPAPAVQAPTLNQTAAEAHGETSAAGVRRRWRKRGCLPPRHGRTPPPPPPSIARGPSRGPSLPQACDCGGQSAAVLSAQVRPLSATGSTRRSESLTKSDGREGSTARHLGRRGQKKRASPDPPAAARASPRRSRPTAPLPPPASPRTRPSPPQSRTESAPRSARPHSTHCTHNHRHLNFFPLSVIPGRSEGCQRQSS